MKPLELGRVAKGWELELSLWPRHIFQCQPPWRLEQRISAPVDPMTKTTFEWCCVAFSPLSEVDDKKGKAGQDGDFMHVLVGMFARTHALKHKHPRIHSRPGTHARTNVCMCMCVYACMLACSMYACMYVCM